jgi:cell division protein FtsL/serine/threonine protein phosphatase PrpC
MSDFPFSYDKILLQDQQNDHSTCHIFVSHQSLAEEKSLGKLFLLAEIKSTDTHVPEIISQIQEEAKLSYFNTDDLNIETAFEKALEKVNQKVADMVGDYDLNWLDRFSGTLAILKGNNLHFSNIGATQVFLVRNQRIQNIIQTTAEHEITGKINPLKAFSHIISGSLQPGDVLIFCTPSLLDYLSLEKIKRTVSDYNAHQASSSLERLLSENANNASIAVLIVKLEADNVPASMPATARQTAPQVSYAPDNRLTPQSSMDELLNKGVATEKIMSPSLSGYVWQSVKRGFSSVTSFVRLKILRESPRRVHWQQQVKGAAEYSPTVASSRKTTLPGKDTVSKILTTSAAASSKGFQFISNLFKKKDKTATDVKFTPRLKPSLTRYIVSFKKLPRLSKILFLAAIVIVFFLSQSIYSLAAKNYNKEQNLDVNQTISDITQKISQAEAALTYNNEDGAKQLLADAKTLLDTLPDKSKQEKQKISELQADIDKQLQKTKHLVEVASPAVVADLAAQDNTVDANSLSFFNNTLFTFDPGKKNIYNVTADSGQVVSFPLETDNGLLYLLPQNNQTLLILNSANKLDSFTLTNKKLSALNFNFASTDINIAGMAYYENRLYFLDIKNNQILRSNSGSGGFSTPVSWIKDSTDVREVVSLVVDGNIYTLDKNGGVTRLTSGQKQAWTLSTVEPALTKANKIWTDVETKTKNLYVLDSTGKRIVEFSKEDGKFLNQYVSPAFNSIKDFTVDPAGKKIYVLDGNKILALDLAT